MRLRVGFLFQEAALFDSLSVFENVAFGLRAKGGVRRRRTCGTASATGSARSGLPADVEGKMPAELSGGMRKRVGLARALALDPDVMLYDEPTTGLDPIMTDVINDLIVQTRRRRPVTSVIVTHEMRTVRKVADRVVMLYPLAKLTPAGTRFCTTGPRAGWISAPDGRRAPLRGGAMTAMSVRAADGHRRHGFSNSFLSNSFGNVNSATSSSNTGLRSRRSTILVGIFRPSNSLYSPNSMSFCTSTPASLSR